MKLKTLARDLPLFFWPTVIIWCLGLSACGVIGEKPNDQNKALKPPQIFLASDWLKLKEKSKNDGENNQRARLPTKSQNQVQKTPEPSNAGQEDDAVLNAQKMDNASSLPVQSEPLESGGVRVQANQCWAQMIVKPLRDQSVQEVTIEDSRDSFKTTPPELSTSTQKVVVKEGYEAFKVFEPKFKQIIEKVQVKEETKHLVVQPAVYTDQIEWVMTESERVEMQACKNAGIRIAGKPQNSPSFCAVKIPATYKSVTKRVVTQQETVVEKTTPAVYKSIVKTVLVENGSADPIQIPPLTANVPVTLVARKAESIKLRVEPKTIPIALTTYTTAPQLTWRRIVCEKDSSPSLIRNLQAALLKEGFDAGPIDAKLGKKTMHAIESYQIQKGVASGTLTYETLKLLGLPLE
ncbi:hypothetical protein B9Z45_06125 [Limnohabitans sp. 2KL-17]|uniref:peptidoglycan-binding domain-containing protein n=1 Tax=Limnohabitans sp. 2KL-17 TaxID=1100704 RepID=UPI000D35FB8D|nr:peptidoglycan-binding domain-containing protein [Limnohabitans sp. 2KL-17]PUE61487.1 hypothetical protein B9Z45_06125 [Limnohabitans sp. 2KL-17]